MIPKVRILVVVLFVVAGVVGFIGFHVPVGYSQGLVGNVAATVLGLAAAILLVSIYLTSSEKGAAAAPLLKLIAPAVTELNNELFIGHLRDTFGIEKGKTLVGIYRKNKRDPHAFSPDQCNELYDAIVAKEADLVHVYDILIDQFRELSMITGWSFDPAITAAALEARLNFIKFKTIQALPERGLGERYQVVEAYLDGGIAAQSVVAKLADRLGWALMELRLVLIALYLRVI